MKEFIGRRYNVKSRILLCPVGINLDKIRNIANQKSIKSNKIRIGFLGSLAWWRGADLLAHAVSIIIRRCPTLNYLLLVMDLYVKKLWKYVKQTTLIMLLQDLSLMKKL